MSSYFGTEWYTIYLPRKPRTGSIPKQWVCASSQNGAEMLKFLKKNETKTLNDREKKPEPERTRQCIQKGESSILDFTVVENGNGKETEVHVLAADVGTTDNCLIWTVNRRELSKIGAVGNCTNGEWIN